MNLIVAVDNNWGIGKNNKLLASIPGDMRMFQSRTMNKIVVMGRKTFESLPKRSPLVNRTNIVLTRREYNQEGIKIVHSVERLLKELKNYPSDNIYVIGGDIVYRQMLPYCDTAYVTKINYEYDADTFFPNLDKMDDWTLMEVGEENTYFDLEYRFIKYRRIE